MARFASAAAWFAIPVALALLWLFPSVLFPSPGANDAIVLADLELPLLMLGLVGLVLGFAVFRGRRATVVRVGLGVFLLGVAADFVIGLAAFGNLSNDRFAALIFLPVPVGVAGLTAIVLGLAFSARRPDDLLRAALFGLAAAAVVGAWVLLRGSRDWLLAPYGFDVIAQILVVGAAVVVLSGQVREGVTGG